MLTKKYIYSSAFRPLPLEFVHGNLKSPNLALSFFSSNKTYYKDLLVVF